MPCITAPKLTCFCTKKWHKYPLINNSNWSPCGSLDPEILRDLSDYCQQTGKWKELPLVQEFLCLSAKYPLCSSSRSHILIDTKPAPEELPLLQILLMNPHCFILDIQLLCPPASSPSPATLGHFCRQPGSSFHPHPVICSCHCGPLPREASGATVLPFVRGSWCGWPD